MFQIKRARITGSVCPGQHPFRDNDLLLHGSRALMWKGLLLRVLLCRHHLPSPNPGQLSCAVSCMTMTTSENADRVAALLS